MMNIKFKHLPFFNAHAIHMNERMKNTDDFCNVSSCGNSHAYSYVEILASIPLRPSPAVDASLVFQECNGTYAIQIMTASYIQIS